MVENRPFLTVITHIVLILGVAMIALPIWITFVAASHDEIRMLQAPIPMLPGSYFVDNLKQTLFGAGLSGGQTPVWRMLLNSLAMALMIWLAKSPFRSFLHLQLYILNSRFAWAFSG